MASNVRKSMKSGCIVALVCIAGCTSIMYYFGNKEYEYSETAPGVDYSWEGVSVGAVTRFPLGRPMPGGRYAAIVRFPTDNPASRTILWQGTPSEEPSRPAFVSGDGPKVTYKVDSGQELVFDLSEDPNTTTKTPN